MTFATSNRRAPLCAVALLLGIVAVPAGCVIDLAGIPGSGGASPSTSTSTSTSSSSETTSSTGGSTSSTGGSTTGTGTGGAPPICMQGDTQDCYSGPPNTVGKGVCANGKATCTPDGKGFGPCMGAVTPTFDDCFTAEDEDCDGTPLACKGDPVGGNTLGSPGSDDSLFDVASDQLGNIYVAGAAGYSGDGSYFAVSGGSAIVTKIDATGTVVWSKTYPAGGGYSVARGVAVDPSGDVTITGYFQGAIAANGVSLTSFGTETDLFVIKLDAGGSPKWGHAYGKDGNQIATSVSTDAAGNVFVSGFLNGPMDFAGNTIVAKGTYDAFVLRLDANGTPKWSASFGTASKQFAWRVAAGPDGNVAVTGDFDQSIVFPGATPTTLTTAGGQDIFLAKLQGDTGATIWAQRFGNNVNQTAYALAIDSKNNIVIGGPAAGAVKFGTSDLAAAGGFDAYVAHFDKAGVHQWSQMFGDGADQSVVDVAIDPADNVLIAGQLQGTMSINGTSLKQMGGGGHDIFVAKLKGTDGTGGWAQRYGDDKDQEVWGLASDPSGDAVVVGGFQGKIDLGQPVGSLMAAGGNYDAFWVKLGP